MYWYCSLLVATWNWRDMKPVKSLMGCFSPGMLNASQTRKAGVKEGAQEESHSLSRFWAGGDHISWAEQPREGHDQRQHHNSFVITDDLVCICICWHPKWWWAVWALDPGRAWFQSSAITSAMALGKLFNHWPSVPICRMRTKLMIT